MGFRLLHGNPCFSRCSLTPVPARFRRTRVAYTRVWVYNKHMPFNIVPACLPARTFLLTLILFWNQYCLPPLCVCVQKKMCLSFWFFSSLALLSVKQCVSDRTGRGKAPVPHNERMKVCLMSHNSHFSDFRLAYSFCAVLYISSNTETQRLLFLFLTMICFVSC